MNPAQNGTPAAPTLLPGMVRQGLDGTPNPAQARARFAPQNTFPSQPIRFNFQKAVKRGAKLRLAVAGPGGSGKTYSLLKIATELGGRIAVVDTEHGSASKYADQFDFDVLELTSYDPAIVPELIASVASQGFATLIIDSLSHFWMGKDGELDQVDQITLRSKSNSSWAAWRDVSPKHNRMVDAMLSAPLHVLASMRVKTEWVVEKDDKGKTVPRKVGLQPVMREGIEYEFDVCADMDQKNTMVVTKSRCPKLSGGVFSKPGSEVATLLKAWLDAPSAPMADAAPSETPAATGEELQTAESAPEPATAPDNNRVPVELEKIWRRMKSPSGILAEFGRLGRALAETLGADAEAEFSRILNQHGVEDPMSFRTNQAARRCAKDLFWRVEQAAMEAMKAPECLPAWQTANETSASTEVRHGS